MDPDALTMPGCPVSPFPDVIAAPYIIPGPVDVIRPVTDLHCN
jgi:hypothetical protein